MARQLNDTVTSIVSPTAYVSPELGLLTDTPLTPDLLVGLVLAPV